MARSKLLLALMFGMMLTGCGGEDAPEISPELSPAPLPIETQAVLTELSYEGALLPLDELCDALGYELEIIGENLADIEGRELEYYPEDGVVRFNGRYIYAPEGWEQSEDGIMLEAEAAAKILGLGLKREGESFVVDISRSALLPGGESYYELHYDMDMLYWLPQIIHAEAYQQPMAGLIGVGNVVMNRMESEKFPNSITNVIFDREHVIQFEPVENGSIKAEADERAKIAAYLCLEGCNTVGDSLFFVNPAYGSHWFDTQLELTHVIGEHNFYRYK